MRSGSFAFVWCARGPLLSHEHVVSSVRVRFSTEHAFVTIWNRGALAGTLTIKRADWCAFLAMLGFDAEAPDSCESIL